MSKIYWNNLDPEVVDKINESSNGIVKTVNNIAPDINGNVNTAFRIIPTMKMDTDWTDDGYPLGISEFTANYDPANYEDYIKAHPSYEVIPKGKIMVRTYKDTISSPAVVWQFIDSTEDTIFYAQFFRVGNSDGTWGEIGIDNPSHVIHIKKPMSPSAIITDYPRGISVFDATYDEDDLAWYDALGLMNKETYKQDVGSYPKGSIAVTSFRNETLINQIIQMTDEHTGTIGTFTRYYDSEIVPNGWIGGNTLDSGLDGRVRSVNGKTPKVNGSVTLTASDVDTYNKEEIDDKIGNASGSYTLPIATQTTLGGVKVDGKTITIDPITGVISSTTTSEDGIILHTQAVLSTTVVNQTKWKIPFPTYTPSEDLLIVSYNSTILDTNNYSIIQNDDGASWDVDIPMSPPNTRPINGTVVFVIMVKGRLSGGSGSGANIEDTLTSTSSINALSSNMGRELKESQDNHEKAKASKTAFGHMQVGDGLTVSDGVVSVERTNILNFEIDTTATQYPLGVTDIPIQTDYTSKYYTELCSLLNSTLGFHLGNNLFYTFYVKIIKRSDTSIRQEASVISNIAGSEGYEMFKLERDTNPSNGSFYPWRVIVNTMVGRDEPENVIPAMRGCLYFDCRNGKLYRKNTGISDAPITGWSVIAS